MIQLSRLNGKEFVVNCEMIKFVEATPDTVITLNSGEKFMVRESVEQVIRGTLDWRKRISQEPPEAKSPGGSAASAARETRMS